MAPLLCALGFASKSRAQDQWQNEFAQEVEGARSVGVTRFDGKLRERAERSIVRALSKQSGTHVLAPSLIEEKLKGFGLPTSPITDYAALSDALELDAVVSGETQQTRKLWKITVRVFNGADGEKLGEASWVHKKLAVAISNAERELLEKIGDQVHSASRVAQGANIAPIGEADGEDVAHTPEELAAKQRAAAAASKPKAEHHQVSPRRSAPPQSVFDAEVGFRLFSRKLSYSVPQSGQTPYKLGPVPAFHAALNWYPGAYFSKGWISRIGIEGTFNYGLGLESNGLSTPGTFPTKYAAYSLGLHGLIPFGIVAFGPLATVSGTLFKVEPDPATQTAPGIPTASYGALNLGLIGKLALGSRVNLSARAAYLVMLSQGQIHGLYPQSTGWGLFGDATLGVKLFWGFDARLGINYQRYVFSMHAPAGAVPSAQGATDQYLSGTFSIGYQLP